MKMESTEYSYIVSSDTGVPSSEAFKSMITKYYKNRVNAPFEVIARNGVNENTCEAECRIETGWLCCTNFFKEFKVMFPDCKIKETITITTISTMEQELG